MPLIKAGEVVADPWRLLAEEEPAPAEGPVVVTLERWQREQNALLRAPGPARPPPQGGPAPARHRGRDRTLRPHRPRVPQIYRRARLFLRAHLCASATDIRASCARWARSCATSSSSCTAAASMLSRSRAPTRPKPGARRWARSASSISRRVMADHVTHSLTLPRPRGRGPLPLPQAVEGQEIPLPFTGEGRGPSRSDGKGEGRRGSRFRVAARARDRRRRLPRRPWPPPGGRRHAHTRRPAAGGRQAVAP